MSPQKRRPQKRRPQARKGRTAAAARTSGRRSDRTLAIAAAFILILGLVLVFVFKPNNSTANELQIGDHWHAALGVYACDHWDGGSDWATPVNPSGGEPVRVNSLTYAGLHSHRDGLIHMEPQTSDEMGKHATLGQYFNFNGFELSSTHVKFATADLKNGDKCGTAPGKLHWLVNGTERTGNPADYLLHNGDWIVVAFLPDSKTITSLGVPPSFAHLATQGVKANNPPKSTSTTAPPTATGPAGSTTSSAPSGSTSSTPASSSSSTPTT